MVSLARPLRITTSIQRSKRRIERNSSAYGKINLTARRTENVTRFQMSVKNTTVPHAMKDTCSSFYN